MKVTTHEGELGWGGYTLMGIAVLVLVEMKTFTPDIKSLVSIPGSMVVHVVHCWAQTQMPENVTLSCPTILQTFLNNLTCPSIFQSWTQDWPVLPESPSSHWKCSKGKSQEELLR